MPRSKRAKVVHLSKLDKKGRILKEKTFANIQEAALNYPYIYVFSVDNMRNTLLKDVRAELGSDSRLFFGKTKVMAKALGSSAASEPSPGTHKLSSHLHGAVGLIFTPRIPASIESYFDSFRPLDYARAGAIASRSFTIPPGTVYSRAGEIDSSEDIPVPHTIEPVLRKLGVPTRLVKGRVELDSEYQVCSEGQKLGSAQTALLKMFGVVSSEFRVVLRAYWERESGAVVEFEGQDGEDAGMDIDGNTHKDQDDDDKEDSD